jgi:RNA polymerase sigma factor (sigma-70 family)
MHRPPTNSSAHVETELDALLIRIDAVALALAREIVVRHAAADIAHDVVLECLVKIRDGTWDVAPEDLIRCVRRMVQSKAVDQLRQRQRRDERELQHATRVEAIMHAWMSPDQSAEERELEALEEGEIAELPEEDRDTYLLARDRGQSYTAIAALLGLSESAVSHRIVRARRRLRSRLRAKGIVPPPPTRGGASQRAHRVGSSCRRGRVKASPEALIDSAPLVS